MPPSPPHLVVGVGPGSSSKEGASLSPTQLQAEYDSLRSLRRRSLSMPSSGALLDPDLPPSPTLASPPASPPLPHTPPDADADDDSPISSLFWLPARLHPEIAPDSFRDFLREHTDPESLLRRTSSFGRAGHGVARKKSMLSRQVIPSAHSDDDTSDIDKPSPTTGAKLDRRKSQLEKLTLGDLQKLEELAEKVANARKANAGDEETDADREMRSYLNRSLSLSPAALMGAASRLPSNQSTTPDADSPLIVPPPGSILRRSARTKIRKPSLLGDGNGHRFGPSRRVASHSSIAEEPSSDSKGKQRASLDASEWDDSSRRQSASSITTTDGDLTRLSGMSASSTTLDTDNIENEVSSDEAIPAHHHERPPREPEPFSSRQSQLQENRFSTASNAEFDIVTSYLQQDTPEVDTHPTEQTKELPQAGLPLSALPLAVESEAVVIQREASAEPALGAPAIILSEQDDVEKTPKPSSTSTPVRERSVSPSRRQALPTPSNPQLSPVSPPRRQDSLSPTPKPADTPGQEPPPVQQPAFIPLPTPEPPVLPPKPTSPVQALSVAPSLTPPAATTAKKSTWARLVSRSSQSGGSRERSASPGPYNEAEVTVSEVRDEDEKAAASEKLSKAEKKEKKKNAKLLSAGNGQASTAPPTEKEQRRTSGTKESGSSFFGSLFQSSTKKEKAEPPPIPAYLLAAPSPTASAMFNPTLGGYTNFYRLPIHVERAVYRLSHIKLANPRRALYEQVLISNLMFWYLSVINKPTVVGHSHPSATHTQNPPPQTQPTNPKWHQQPRPPNSREERQPLATANGNANQQPPTVSPEREKITRRPLPGHQPTPA